MRNSCMLAAWALSLLLLVSCIGTKQPPTSIKIVVTSDPSEAVLMAGPSPSNMRYIGITPRTETHTAVAPFWKSGCFKFFKYGYYDDLQCFGQSQVNMNRYIHSKLIPIAMPEETDSPKSKDPAPEQKNIPVEPSDKTKIERSKYGTGFFINTRGYFVSNEHVVKDCKQIEATNLSVKSTAQTLFIDAKNDIVVLKLEVSSPQQSSTFRIGNGRCL